MGRNVVGGELSECCSSPLTGFYRTGSCETGADDHGVHVVCAQMTDEFLEFSSSIGNDLSTPQPGFDGLRPGDCWCLCASRWKEALDAGVAPPVKLTGTHVVALEWIDMADLRAHAIDGDG